MKAQTSGKDQMNLGFEVVPAGTYLWVFGDDPKIQMKDDVRNGSELGPKNIIFPVSVKGVIEGDGKEGAKGSIMFNLVDSAGEVNERGEQNLNDLLFFAGVFDELKEKTQGKDFDPTTSTAFHQFLATALPGKVIKAKHSIGTYNDKEQMRFEIIESAGAAPPDASNSEVEGDWS